MKRSRILAVFLACLLWGIAGCGGKNTRSSGNSPDTSTIVGAPDNNSANNPSLADTSYEKNRTKPISDTMKQKDTVRSGRR